MGQNMFKAAVNITAAKTARANSAAAAAAACRRLVHCLGNWFNRLLHQGHGQLPMAFL